MSSERQLRDLVTHMDQLWGPIHPFVEDMDVFLNRDPDVAAVLRLVVELMGAMPQRAENVQARATLDLVYRRIAERFHVRLTADGWKWTEEADENTS